MLSTARRVLLDGNECQAVDQWTDGTDLTEVTLRKPGIGKTFGALAVKVLGTIHGGDHRA